MFTRITRWSSLFIIALLAVFIATGISQPVQASSASQSDMPSNSCLTCHEDLYYLYDTGSLYCLTDHTDRCANCHEGNPVAMQKEESHLGLVSHPQENNGAKCKECHTVQEAQTRLTTFASAHPFEPVVTEIPYIPAHPVILGFPQEESNAIVDNWIWLVGGVVVFGFLFALFLLSPKKP